MNIEILIAIIGVLGGLIIAIIGLLGGLASALFGLGGVLVGLLAQNFFQSRQRKWSLEDHKREIRAGQLKNAALAVDKATQALLETSLRVSWGLEKDKEKLAAIAAEHLATTSPKIEDDIYITLWNEWGKTQNVVEIGISDKERASRAELLMEKNREIQNRIIELLEEIYIA